MSIKWVVVEYIDHPWIKLIVNNGPTVYKLPEWYKLRSKQCK